MKNNKPLGGKSYGSIPHLIGSKLGIGDHHIHEGQNKILTQKTRDKNDLVIVTEKYDGSNVCIANIDGKIEALTRSGYRANTSPYKQHHAFNAWVKRNYSELKLMLPENSRLSCEWLYKRHSLSYLYYQNSQENNIVCFDLFKDNRRVNFYDFLNSDTWLIPKARVLHIGGSVEPKNLLTKLNGIHSHTVFCDEKPEGLVYRCERNGSVDFLAKWVRSDFKAGLYL